MFQTESLMLVLLGFSLASVIALFIGRLAWNVALRMGAKRMQQNVPSTVIELQAERDRLRAEYAIGQQRFEQRLAELQARMAEHMAEVTRHRNRFDLMKADIARHDQLVIEKETEVKLARDVASHLEKELADRIAAHQAQGEELAARNAEIERLSGELGLRNGELERMTGELAALRAELAAREEAVSRLDAALAERASRLDAALAEGARQKTIAVAENRSAQERLRDRVSALKQLGEEIAQGRERLVAERSQLAALPPAPAPGAIDVAAEIEGKIAKAEHESAALQEELQALDRDWAATLAKLEAEPEAAVEVLATPADAAAPAVENASAQPQAENNPARAEMAEQPGASGSSPGDGGRSGDTPQPEPERPASVPVTLLQAEEAESAAPDKPAPDEERGVARVVSLAQRIRSLQSDIANKG